MTAKRLGRMLKALRERKGLTQMKLAKKAKLAQSYIAKIESGVKQNPSLTILQRLAKALGVPVTELLK